MSSSNGFENVSNTYLSSLYSSSVFIAPRYRLNIAFAVVNTPATSRKSLFPALPSLCTSSGSNPSHRSGKSTAHIMLNASLNCADTSLGARSINPTMAPRQRVFSPSLVPTGFTAPTSSGSLGSQFFFTMFLNVTAALCRVIASTWSLAASSRTRKRNPSWIDLERRNSSALARCDASALSDACSAATRADVSSDIDPADANAKRRGLDAKRVKLRRKSAAAAQRAFERA